MALASVINVSPEIGAFLQQYPDEDTARKYLESIRWPNGPACPWCRGTNIVVIPPNPNHKVRSGLYQCRPCHRQFTVTVETPMHQTKLPLQKWLLTWWLLTKTTKPITGAQLARAINVGYNTACDVTRRIGLIMPRLRASLAASKNC
jgi:transposase-like protein